MVQQHLGYMYDRSQCLAEKGATISQAIRSKKRTLVCDAGEHPLKHRHSAVIALYFSRTMPSVGEKNVHRRTGILVGDLGR